MRLLNQTSGEGHALRVRTDANQLQKKLPRLIKILDAMKRARRVRLAAIARANGRSVLPIEMA